ncbi:MAG: hypothetical protein Q4C95_06050 [Planctomycetia bacterium]|nr:hypothetical protein [Planctomycetia bacterium]
MTEIKSSNSERRNYETPEVEINLFEVPNIIMLSVVTETPSDTNPGVEDPWA